MFNFHNQHVLVTGGTSGIGLTIAERFQQAGAKVTIIGRSKTKLANLTTFKTICLDLSDQQALLAIRDLVNEPVDHLINNAAIAKFIPFSECTPEQLNEHISVNLAAPFLLTQQLLPLLRGGSSILNISSYFSKKMIHACPSSMYSLTKGGLDSLTKSLAFELGSKQIRVNAIAPGSTKTPLFESNINKLPADKKAEFEQRIPHLYPLGRIGSTEDIANLALFLCSPLADWITGSIVNIDGGLTAH